MKPLRLYSRGLSLLEVVIAAGMMLMILTAVYAIAEALQRSQIVTEARMDARRAIRTGVNRFVVSAAGAQHFFPGSSSGAALSINGRTCHLPYVDGSGNRFDGDTVAIAVPQDLTSAQTPGEDPEDPDTDLHPLGSAGAVPDGVPDHAFAVLVLTTQARQGTSRTPGARDMVLMRWDQVTPSVPREPASIDLEALGAPSNVKTYDTYLRPLDEEGFVVRYLAQEDQPVSSCIVKTKFRHVPLQGPTQEESYEFVFTTRNG